MSRSRGSPGSSRACRPSGDHDRSRKVDSPPHEHRPQQTFLPRARPRHRLVTAPRRLRRRWPGRPGHGRHAQMGHLVGSRHALAAASGPAPGGRVQADHRDHPGGPGDPDHLRPALQGAGGGRVRRPRLDRPGVPGPVRRRGPDEPGPHDARGAGRGGTEDRPDPAGRSGVPQGGAGRDRRRRSPASPTRRPGGRGRTSSKREPRVPRTGGGSPRTPGSPAARCPDRSRPRCCPRNSPSTGSACRCSSCTATPTR